MDRSTQLLLLLGRTDGLMCHLDQKWMFICYLWMVAVAILLYCMSGQRADMGYEGCERLFLFFAIFFFTKDVRNC
jgi:hypothetical protein